MVEPTNIQFVSQLPWQYHIDLYSKIIAIQNILKYQMQNALYFQFQNYKKLVGLELDWIIQ